MVADSEELVIFHLITFMQLVQLLEMIEFIFVSTVTSLVVTRGIADTQVTQKDPSQALLQAITIIIKLKLLLHQVILTAEIRDKSNHFR